jgi:hypothetical protein
LRLLTKEIAAPANSLFHQTTDGSTEKCTATSRHKRFYQRLKQWPKGELGVATFLALHVRPSLLVVG